MSNNKKVIGSHKNDIFFYVLGYFVRKKMKNEKIVLYKFEAIHFSLMSETVIEKNTKMWNL